MGAARWDFFRVEGGEGVQKREHWRMVDFSVTKSPNESFRDLINY